MKRKAPKKKKRKITKKKNNDWNTLLQITKILELNNIINTNENEKSSSDSNKNNVISKKPEINNKIIIKVLFNKNNILKNDNLKSANIKENKNSIDNLDINNADNNNVVTNKKSISDKNYNNKEWDEIDNFNIKIKKNDSKENSIKNNLNDIGIISSNINSEFKNIAGNPNGIIEKNNADIVEVKGDGNFLFRYFSFFLFGTQIYYLQIKNLIIEWMENNYDKFTTFFGDDDNHNLTKEQLTKEEFEYTKEEDSWGGDLKINIFCIIFNNIIV